MQTSRVYILLSMAFAFANAITLSHLSPWIDEVMMLDTSYNMAFHGSWETTAWYRVVGQYPFSTYPPLYQMLATVWMWLFGGSLIVVRSMNLLFTFTLGCMSLRLMERHRLQLTQWSTALFTMLLWGTSEMAWMYRNGRPDMLCALVFVFTVFAIDRYLLVKSRVHRLAVIATSALLLCSGLQAAVYLCALWLFFFITMRGQRGEAVRLLVLLLSGFLLGLGLVSLFMLAHGRLMAFACSIIQYSATLSDLALTVLPWAGEFFDFNSEPFMQKLQELNTETSLIQQFSLMVEYRSFVILFFVALLAYTAYFRRNWWNLLSDKGFMLLLCALYVPVMMNLAGRFTSYYRWMAFLPLIVSVTSIASRHRFCCIAFSIVTILLTLFGIRSMWSADQWNHKNLHSFVQRQHFKPSDAVVCPFSTFYEIKPVCDTCYFVGIFPTDYLGHVDYIIEPSNGNEFDQPITDYVNRLKADSTVVLTTVDHCEHPSLTLYQVQTKHE